MQNFRIILKLKVAKLEITVSIIMCLNLISLEEFVSLNFHTIFEISVALRFECDEKGKYFEFQNENSCMISL